MKKSLARPILHDTPRQPLTQANGYNGRNVYMIEEHQKMKCGTGLNGHTPAKKCCIHVDSFVPSCRDIQGIRRVFANSAARKVIVRLSNGSGMIESDEARDLRGMALKIFVPGLSSVDGHTQADVQDILATNAPGHHAKDIVKLMEFSEAFSAGGLTKTAFLTANPMIMARLLSQTGRNVNSLLSETYWSRAPFSFGKNRTIKYVLRPLTKFSQVAGESDQSAERLTRDLDKKMADLDARDKIRYGLFVQFQIDPRTEPVEDHFTEWQTGEVKLAEITFAKQLVDRSQSCESLAFNPWNAGVDHRPMGNMNRARKFIYEASVNFRK